MNRKQVRMFTILICSILIILSYGQGNFLSMQSIGYSSGYEGVKASFVAIEHEYHSESAKTDLLQGTSFYFDPDEPNANAPNLVGEMTNAFVPEQPVPSWVPSDWFMKSQSYINNPVDIDTWTLPNPDNTDEIIAYEVQEWILKMYVSITCEWDEYGDIVTWGNAESQDQRFTNTKVWLELSINKPSWIFEGQAQAYFAIGKVTCSDFAYGKLGQTEDDYTPTDAISVTPESTSWMYVYYQKYGSGGQVAESDPFSFKGRTLNPELFTDKVYCHVALNNFGTQHDTVLFDTWDKGDAVTWGFDVHVFVVGEWKVQDTSELPDDYGRTPKVQIEQSWLTGLVQDPRFQLWSFIGLIAIMGLLLAIFAPWVLFSIFSMLGGIRKR